MRWFGTQPTRIYAIYNYKRFATAENVIVAYFTSRYLLAPPQKQ